MEIASRPLAPSTTDSAPPTGVGTGSQPWAPSSIHGAGVAAVLVAVSPAHHHVRFDRLAGLLQIGAGFVHVEANRMDLVAFGLG